MAKRSFSPPGFIRRKRHSKGFGVHSPFAFDLITNTLRDDCRFYAFCDIKKRVIDSGTDPAFSDKSFDRLAFRLVHRFKPENILEINSAKCTNTLFMLAPDERTRCTCIETLKPDIDAAGKLLGTRQDRVVIIGEEELHSVKKYDAICIHLSGAIDISMDQLFAKSHENTFWLIDGIKNKKSKQFWNNIVNDERVRFTFDMKRSGIAFLQSSYHKLNYLI